MIDIGSVSGPMIVYGFDVDHTEHEPLVVELVREDGTVMVHTMCLERSHAVIPFTDWNRPLWHASYDQEIVVLAEGAVLLRASKAVTGWLYTRPLKNVVGVA